MSTVVAVVGLGYVGLPLAVEFGKIHETIGFDLSDAKIKSYRAFIDPTGEVTPEELKAAKKLRVTANPSDLKAADHVIVAVPTPIDAAHLPDFGPLVGASRTVGQNLKKGAIVIYESTVYPGATEEVCIPLLEQHSGLKWKQDFHVGYSPERINPGDKVAALYGSVITAGVHRVSSIAVAEAAKVIENTQRDLNIALMNELALIFNKLGIDTVEVLQAAGTKWNFLPFRPGLVGGHCIGVDPYYLTHKAEMIGYHPEVILSGRRVNDNMGKFIAEQTIKQMIATGSSIKGAKVNVLGLTFKENVPDLRNSRVIDVINELRSYGVQVFVHDPLPTKEDAKQEYGIDLLDWNQLPVADAMVAAVAHRLFLALPSTTLAEKVVCNGCFIDVKSAFDTKTLSNTGLKIWRL
jgi:UDP-N-acetyl-D-galactosamine dehydrogenase